MTTVRQRKRTNALEQNQINSHTEKNTKPNIKEVSGPTTWGILSHIIGAMMAIALGLLTSYYVATLHENDLWFSNIKDVEREISFRTECGLYYSYYKQMLLAPSIKQGIIDLIYDNKTESMRTINILQRMNVYQEVVLATIYRYLPFWNYLEPVYFYIYTLFGLQTLYVSALYINSWLLSRTWLSGLLTAIWYIFNRVDTTRVEFTIPLRENWALPFFAVQIAGITYLLRPNLTALKERMALSVVFISTFIFSITWQFNQFVLLLQALVLFALDCSDMIPAIKVAKLYLIQVTCLLAVCVLQFNNTMILGSLVLSFVIAAMLVRRLQVTSTTYRIHINYARYRLCYSKVSAYRLHSGSVYCHMQPNVPAKLKPQTNRIDFILCSCRDFDASLYLCEEAFRQLPFDTFGRFSDTLLFYPYLCVLFILTMAALATTFNNFSSSNPNNMEKEKKKPIYVKPDVAYNLMHTILFGCLALSTMRMKYLWTSHMCVFASFGLCSIEVWGMLLKCFRLYTAQRANIMRYFVSIAVIIYLLFKFSPRIMEELSELREFYDPDTVQLMNWIKLNTPKNAVFAGSMQLLAGVKLCTGRVLTNHPHYEDKTLRERTKQVYQIYANRSPEDVHSILRSFGTDYAILEDSICYERRHGRGCRLRDLLDLDNGHIMDGPGDNDPDLKPSPSPRFCDEIKRDLPSYSKYFTRVFKNKTFHVYRLSRKTALK
eukprot:XP_017948632.1 PREDICTED: probable C-mannosyltransferase DPY19L3 [Xenopus tropicalis]